VPTFEVAGLIAVVGLGWFWLDGIKARDIAVAAARRACDAEGLQFLDESVSVASTRLARDDAGTLRIRRSFNFEYSDTGDNRRPGDVGMLGHRVTSVSLALSTIASIHTLH
jgi:hypothetical protein